jgi:hypothetical protein
VVLYPGRNPTDPFLALVESGGAVALVAQFVERGGGLFQLRSELKDLDSHRFGPFFNGYYNYSAPSPRRSSPSGGRRIA